MTKARLAVCLCAVAFSTPFAACTKDDGGGGTSDASIATDGGNQPNDAQAASDGGDAQAAKDSGGALDASSDDDSGNPDASTPPAVDDPLPDAQDPGEYTCTGCPDSSDITDFEPDYGAVTSHAFTGTVTGAAGNGTFYVENADGQTFSGTIPTDATTGVYNVTVPLLCGDQTVKLVWSNPLGTYGVVLDANTTDCVDADIRVTLTWDVEGFDFEAHLIREGGHINDRTGDRFYSNDCTWNTCIGGSSDWGVEADATDNPKKDVDNTGNYGPENIFYAKPEDGKYTVMIEHWGGGAATADGNVIINVVGKPTVSIPITDLASHFVFTAATIDWPSGTITTVGTQYDCTATWSGGCTALIP